MKPFKTGRGFRGFEHPNYRTSVGRRVVQESSAVGEHKDSLSHAGSSFLWVGDDLHLNRKEIKQLVKIMQHWLKKKRLPNT